MRLRWDIGGHLLVPDRLEVAPVRGNPAVAAVVVYRLTCEHCQQVAGMASQVYMGDTGCPYLAEAGT